MSSKSEGHRVMACLPRKLATIGAALAVGLCIFQLSALGEIADPAAFLAKPTVGIGMDINGDGNVDQSDQWIVRGGLGSCAGDWNFNPAADFNGDGCVTLADDYLIELHILEATFMALGPF